MRVKLLLSFISSILLVHCTAKSSKSKRIGTIEGIHIDHVLRKRDGCRFPNIYLQLRLNNLSKKAKVYHFFPFSSYCDRIVDSSNLYAVLYNKKAALTVSPNDSLLILKPNRFKKIEVRCMFKFYGTSLKDIYEFQQKYIEADFKVLYKQNNTNFFFEKSKNFSLKMSLDDTLVTKTDTIKYNMSVAAPPQFYMR